MSKLRLLVGLIALAGTATALNLLLIQGQLFSVQVIAPLSLALVAGIIWVGLRVTAGTERSGRGESIAGVSSVVSVFVFLGICITIYAFAARWDEAWDLTREGRTELAPQTVQVLEGLESDVQVLAFFPGLADHRVDIAKDKTERFLERVSDLSWRLNVETLDVEQDILRLQQLGLTSIPRTAVGIVIVKSGNRQRMIALEGINPGLREHDFTNALINVVRDQIAKVYLLAGHGEAAISSQAPERNLSGIRNALTAEGYVVEELGFDLLAPRVPDDCDVLVIPGPEQDFLDAEVAALEAYREQGGRFLIMMDPPFARLPTLELEEHLRPWLNEQWGIDVGNNIVLSLETMGGDLQISPSLEGFPEEENSVFMGSYNYNHPITRGISYKLLMRHTCTVGPAETIPDNVVQDVLIRTGTRAYVEENLQLIVSRGQSQLDAGERKGPVPVAVAATAKLDGNSDVSDTRAVVVGDSDFITNRELPYNPANKDLALNMIAWLVEEDELIGMRAAGEGQQPVILTPGERQFITWVSTLGTLQVIVLVSVGVFLWRRKYQ